MENKMTYAQATKRLEEIVEHKELIAFCKERLYKVDQSVKEILEDDL